MTGPGRWFVGMAYALLIVGTVLPVIAAAQEPADGAPPPRAHHAIVYDAANRRVLLIGGSTPVRTDGRTSYRYFDDIWSFDGSRWTLVGHTGDPRSGQAVAYDAARRRVLAQGGYCGCRRADNGRFPDLLAFNGAGWDSLGMTDRPVTDAIMVYDSRRDRMVMFGGSGGQRETLDQTWEYDGSQWTRIEGEGPGQRGAFAMVYDEKRGRTLLFGGFLGRTPMGDTWEYDGTRWTRVATEGPSPRGSAFMVYDTRRERVLLHGGGATDTWGWDGMRWTKLSDDGPESRGMGAMAYDIARDRVVLFGGRAGPPSRDLNDTWEWDGTRWLEAGSLPGTDGRQRSQSPMRLGRSWGGASTSAQ